MLLSLKENYLDNLGVLRNYGSILKDLVTFIPNGIVCFFPEFENIKTIIGKWNEMGVLNVLMEYKLLFIETPNYQESIEVIIM